MCSAPVAKVLLKYDLGRVLWLFRDRIGPDVYADEDAAYLRVSIFRWRHMLGPALAERGSEADRERYRLANVELNGMYEHHAFPAVLCAVVALVFTPLARDLGLAVPEGMWDEAAALATYNPL